MCSPDNNDTMLKGDFFLLVLELILQCCYKLCNLMSRCKIKEKSPRSLLGFAVHCKVIKTVNTKYFRKIELFNIIKSI